MAWVASAPICSSSGRCGKGQRAGIRRQGSGVREQGAAIGHRPSVIQRAVIELKVLHKSLDATLAEGLAQTWEYADRCRADEAHLVIFDRTPGKAWEEKIFRREEVYRGTEITVWGM
jgi:hypothetical protein